MAQTTEIEWVTLDKYSELTGDKKGAVHQRRYKGLWKEGVQCKIGRNNHLWVNIAEAQKWMIENPTTS